MMEQILSTLGLALRAGSVAVGEEPVGSAARAKHARLILVASDAAPGSVRRAFAFAQTGACLYLVIPAEKAALGRALGRTSCAMCAVTDIGFAGALGKKLAALDPAHFAEASGRLEIKAQQPRSAARSSSATRRTSAKEGTARRPRRKSRTPHRRGSRSARRGRRPARPAEKRPAHVPSAAADTPGRKARPALGRQPPSEEGEGRRPGR